MLQVNMLDDGTVIEKSDECLGVRFFFLAQEDERQSIEAGRPIYRDIEMIEIVIPGSRDVMHRQVLDKDRLRFGRKYEAFKSSNGDGIVIGTPLNNYPFISPSEIKEMEYLNITTGEQLVKMPDGFVDRLGANARDLIKKVKAFNEYAKDTAFVSKMTGENEELKRQMALLQEQMQQILTLKAEDKAYGQKSNDGSTGRRGRKPRGSALGDALSQ